MKKYIATVLIFYLAGSVMAQKPSREQAWSVRMADAFMTWHKDSILVPGKDRARWDYEQGLMLEALKRMWVRTGEGKYFYYIKNDLDRYVQADGSIFTYHLDEYNIDNITPGRALLLMYQEGKKESEKYKKAAFTLRHQLATHPRTEAQGFWHKKRYPYQMWLDGLYMAQPFYAEFSRVFNQTQNFNDIALQFDLIQKNLLDARTGLLYHAYDESREQKWADPQTGLSKNFWGVEWGGM